MTEEQGNDMLYLLQKLSEDNDKKISLLEDIKTDISRIEGKVNGIYDLGDVVNAIDDVRTAVQ